MLAFEDETPTAKTKTAKSPGKKDTAHRQHHNPQSALHKQRHESMADQSLSSGVTDTPVLEKATIVYHESARSIVFRDHLRRAHKHHIKAAAASSSSSAASAPPPAAAKKEKKEGRRRKPRLRSKSNASAMSNISESSDVSSKQLSAAASASASASRSPSHDDQMTFEYSNGTSEGDITRVHGHINPSALKTVSSMDDNDQTPKVIIANFTPEIDPLPPLQLEPHDEFSELLLSNPYVWREGEGPEEAVRNETVWDTLSDAEKDVVDRILHQKCAVKTIKHDDVAAFISKFPIKENDESAKRWMHPKDFIDATKAEKIQKYKECDTDHHSFYTSLSLLPSYGLKMRCYGSTREYPLGVVFALPDFDDEESEDLAAERTYSWSWPAGYAAKTEFNIARNGALINGREEALAPISKLRQMNHSYIYDRDYGEFLRFFMLFVV